MSLIGFDPYAGTKGKYPLSEILALCGKAGFEAFNLYVSPGFFEGNDEAQFKEVAALLAQHKLATPTIHFGQFILCEPGREGDVMAHFTKKVLPAAKRLGVKLLGIWPNLPGVHPKTPVVAKEVALKTLAANLKEIIPQAAEAGIGVTLEFEKGHTLDNYREGIEFILRTDDRIRLTCDTYHLNNDGADPYEATLKMKGRLGDVHLSGTHRGEPGSAGDAFDYEKLFRGLAEIGFAAPLLTQYHLKDVESMARCCAMAKDLRDRYLSTNQEPRPKSHEPRAKS